MIVAFMAVTPEYPDCVQPYNSFRFLLSGVTLSRLSVSKV